MASPLAMSGMRPQRRSAARAGAYAPAHEGGDEDDLQLGEEEEEEEEQAAPRQRGRRAGKGKLLATLLQLRVVQGYSACTHAYSGLCSRRHSRRPARPARSLHFAAAAAATFAVSVQLLWRQRRMRRTTSQEAATRMKRGAASRSSAECRAAGG